MNRWQEAHLHEKAHWERFIAGARKGTEDFWLDLWKEQANFLWPIIERLVGISSDDVIVEIGAGIMGMVRQTDKGIRFIVDPLGNMQQEGHDELFGETPDVGIIVAKAENCTLLENDVSIVIAVDCLDHCDSPEQVLANIHAMLKEDGLFCETTTIFKKPTEWVDNEYGKYHPWLWDWVEFIKIMSSAGFYLLHSYQDWPCHIGFRHEESNSYQYLRIWKKLGVNNAGMA